MAFGSWLRFETRPSIPTLQPATSDNPHAVQFDPFSAGPDIQAAFHDQPLVQPAPNLACVTEPTASGRRQWAIGPSQMPDVRNNAGSTNRIATKNQSRRFVDTTHSSSAMIPRVSGPYSTAR
jgi:hypothetical protein